MVELSEGRGFLFHVRNKKNGRAPDVYMRVMVDGREIKMVGWKRTDTRGDLYYTLEKEIERQT